MPGPSCTLHLILGIICKEARSSHFAGKERPITCSGSRRWEVGSWDSSSKALTSEAISHSTPAVLDFRLLVDWG